MLRIVLWAMATGFVTGAVWFAILFFRRHPRGERPALPPAEEQESISTEHLTRRLLELEERLDATEHLLKRDKVLQPCKPSA